MIFDQQYFQLCSEKTLQSNKEGFFLQFAEGLAENVGEKWLKTFGKLKTDKERIRWIYEDKKVKQHVVDFLRNVQEMYRKKCSATSKKRFLEAEEAYKSGEKKKALALYSQSILKAPNADSTLSLALLSRANLLVALDEYSSALADLQLALQEKIPDHRKFDVFRTMAMCYTALRDDNKAQISLNLAEKLAADPQQLALLRHATPPVREPIRRARPMLPPIGDRHAYLRHASKKLTVKKSREAGRYVVANEEIASGETLVVEGATVACLFPEKFGTHCHHCFDRLLAPVGCSDCAGVAFCSSKCRQEALSTYHRYECKYLDLLIGSGMSVLSLATLRSVTQGTLQECLEIYGTKDRGEGLYGLCTNADKRGAGDFLQRTLMAAFLLRCLQKAGFFKRNDDAVLPTEEEFQVGEMLLHHLQVLQFNAHEIYETLYDEDHRLRGGRPGYVGVGVYPTVALFNHDCYPAVTRYFVGKHVVIKSLRPLPPAAPISENYGPIFTHRTLVDRQRSLSSRYWFNCRCTPCSEDWPTVKTAQFVKRVRCPTANCDRLFSLPLVDAQVKCPKCQNDVCLAENIEKLRWCEEEYEKGAKLVDGNERDEAIEVLLGAIDVFHRVSAPPHGETHLAEEALRVCLGDFGNTCECLAKSG